MTKDQQRKDAAIKARWSYLQSLYHDHKFRELFLNPLDQQAQKYMKQLKSLNSTEQDIYRAQGAVNATDEILNIFARAKRDYDAVLAREKERYA